MKSVAASKLELSKRVWTNDFLRRSLQDGLGERMYFEISGFLLCKLLISRSFFFLFIFHQAGKCPMVMIWWVEEHRTTYIIKKELKNLYSKNYFYRMRKCSQGSVHIYISAAVTPGPFAFSQLSCESQSSVQHEVGCCYVWRQLPSFALVPTKLLLGEFWNTATLLHSFNRKLGASRDVLTPYWPLETTTWMPLIVHFVLVEYERFPP